MAKATLLGSAEMREEGNEGGSPVEFVSRLLDAATAIRKVHLMTTGPGSYAAHEALADVYAALEGHADGLAEAYMGCQQTGITFPGVNAAFGAETRKIYEWIEMNRDMIGYESHIQNKVDELLDQLATALFKLDRLA